MTAPTNAQPVPVRPATPGRKSAPSAPAPTAPPAKKATSTAPAALPRQATSRRRTSTSAPVTRAFGIDIGGSGIKGAWVDLTTGTLVSERKRIKTPKPATPEAMVAVIGQLFDAFEVPDGAPIGVAFPGSILDGVIAYVPNLDQSWIDVNLADRIWAGTGRHVVVLNDADAAGVAEFAFGAAQGARGTVFVTTLGTGIGTALFVDGHLVPNTELGHIIVRGRDAETWMSAAVRDKLELSWKAWAKRLQKYYERVDALIHPDLFVVGGGVSKEHENFLPLIKTRPPLVPAQLRNAAGIVGAAAYAAQRLDPKA